MPLRLQLSRESRVATREYEPLLMCCDGVMVTITTSRLPPLPPRLPRLPVASRDLAIVAVVIQAK